MKLRYADIKANLALVLNMSATDSRILSYYNRATERLVHKAKWVDTLVRYTICTAGGCIVWPREIATIEAWALCSTPGIVRNQWYEFLETGPGLSDCGMCNTGLKDRGNVVAFDEVTGLTSKIAVYSDGPEVAGTRILLRYYDSNAQKVRTTDSGTVIEGEYVTLVAAPAYALTAAAPANGLVLPYGLYEVIKPVTKYPVRLYEYDTVLTTYKPLAYYEPDETLPDYRASLLPTLVGSNGDCTTSKVTVLAKRRFIPAINDNSILSISHADAIRLAVQAVHKEENNLMPEATIYWAQAVQCLRDQLQHQTGDGVVAPIRIVGSNIFGGAIPTLV